MKRTTFPLLMAAVLLTAASAEARLPRLFHRSRPQPNEVNDRALEITLHPGDKGSAVTRAQILLDRLHYSSGEIDGVFGSGLARTVAAFRRNHQLAGALAIDAPMWQLLNAGAPAALVPYTITDQDVAGPYVKIPLLMKNKVVLPYLGYQSIAEAFGERFHVRPDLLTRLNAGRTLLRAGQTILVPNVGDGPPLEKADYVVVDRSDLSVEAFTSDDRLILHDPATIGSRHDPLPVGTWKIEGVARNPVYHYNPDLFWDAEPGDQKATIAAGPNNPVGPVWIDLSKPHYGIHGTPEPTTIGKSFSHGCIRLTNWSALELSQIVSPGTKAILQE
ncbi:MAG TPA: L,D-transpeptidase family protein [Thermoanaerobaculia bacterium]|nr:L,D-transpeptidase family protein [Thermoanaerobaculia bacterium]